MVIVVPTVLAFKHKCKSTIATSIHDQLNGKDQPVEKGEAVS